MVRRARIGELLSRIVPLSGHDVEEILEEQSSNRRRFGEIALAWGLCRPEHLWDAWCQQSEQEGETLDLTKVGIDASAAAMLSGEVARELHVIPVRVAHDCVLIATSEKATDQATEKLSALLRRRIKFVRSDRQQLDGMLDVYYPPVSH